MSLQDILKLLAEKYPQEKYGIVGLVIYDDESGMLTANTEQCYDLPSLYHFKSVDELIAHLQEKES